MLSKSEIASYDKDGFLFPKRVLNGADAAACRSKLEEYFSRFGDQARGSGPMTKRAHIVLRWAGELMRHPAIVDAVEDIIGPDIMCWSSAIFTKEANSRRFVSWHQDANYWGLSNSKVVSAWVALTCASKANGCLRLLPGSHRTLVDHNDVEDGDNMLSRGQTMASLIDEQSAVDVKLLPGEFALFHVNMAHASRPNQSPSDRIGIVFRYVAGDVFQTKSDRDSASLIRGRDLTGFFEHEPMPAYDLEPTCLAFHERVCGARQEVYFGG
jgi:non-heme Fe2+,alpha-ketoglutarate-dependent halogenase